MPARKKRHVDDDLLPLFTSPAPDSTADNQSRIRAPTAEIEQLQKNLDQLIKEREMLGYKKRAPRLDVGQRLHAIFKAVKEVAKWTLGEFLYHVFKLKNEDGTKFSRSSTHVATISQFLQGQTIYSPSDILDAWFRNRDGHVSTESDASKLMYSTDKPFREIGNPEVHTASTFRGFSCRVHDLLQNHIFVC